LVGIAIPTTLNRHRQLVWTGLAMRWNNDMVTITDKGRGQHEDFKAANDRTDIRALAASLGLAVGTGRTIRCPNRTAHAHADATPSARIYPNKNSWKCFACGESGKATQMVALAKGLAILDALRWLGFADGAPPTKKHPTPRHLPTPTETPTGSFLRYGPHPVISQLWAAIERAEERRERDAESWASLSDDVREAVTHLEIRERARGAVFQESDHDAMGWRCLHWLKRRGILPTTATWAGGRDLYPCAHEVRAAISATPRADLIAAGLAKMDGDRFKLWPPLYGAIKGIQKFQGMIFPVTTAAGAVVAFRYRFYNPWLTASGKPVKAMAQYGWRGTGPATVLGLRPAERASRVLLCEGETDWLTVAPYVATDAHATQPLAICNVAAFEEPEAMAWLAKQVEGKKITAALHGEDKAAAFAVRLATALQGRHDGITCTGGYPSEGCDLNDIHRKRRLACWLIENGWQVQTSYKDWSNGYGIYEL
jgi:hypothetical protein